MQMIIWGNKMTLHQALCSENVITGDDNNHLSYRLKQSIKRAEKIDIIISFLMESGVKMLIKDL